MLFLDLAPVCLPGRNCIAIAIAIAHNARMIDCRRASGSGTWDLGSIGLFCCDCSDGVHTYNLGMDEAVCVPAATYLVVCDPPDNYKLGH